MLLLHALIDEFFSNADAVTELNLLLIIDELGYQRMDTDSANLFFTLIAKRYEKSSTIITTNSPFSKWADIFQKPVLTNALLDRLLHHCSVININGPSYRLKDQMQYIMEDN